MSKTLLSVLVGLGLAGCSQQAKDEVGDGPSVGTLRHRGKVYDVRDVVTADGVRDSNDPFLRGSEVESPIMADSHTRGKGY